MKNFALIMLVLGFTSNALAEEIRTLNCALTDIAGVPIESGFYENITVELHIEDSSDPESVQTEIHPMRAYMIIKGDDMKDITLDGLSMTAFMYPTTSKAVGHSTYFDAENEHFLLVEKIVPLNEVQEMTLFVPHHQIMGKCTSL